MFNNWLALAPEAIYWAPKFVQTLWGANEIFITENGCASDDVIADDGKVYDTDRVVFLRSFLTQLQRATADGRSEEHTSELQSRQYLVCRLLLEKKKRKQSWYTRET